MLDVICDKWQNSTNCDSNRKEFKMRTTNNLKHIEKDRRNGDDCLLFENAHSQMVDGGKFSLQLNYSDFSILVLLHLFIMFSMVFGSSLLRQT